MSFSTMRSFAAAAALVALLPQVLALTISTPPQLVACQPVQLSWSEGTPPFYLAIYPGGQSTGALKQFDPTQDSSYTWTVDIDAGTSVTIGVSDSTGSPAYTSPLTVQPGTGDCSTSGGNPSGSSGSPSNSGSGSGSPSPSGSGSPPAESGSGGNDDGAFTSTPFTAGFAGVVALIGAALL